MIQYPDSVEAMIHDPQAPTCSLEDFVIALNQDSNIFWRVEHGHINNLLEEALDRLGML